MTALNQEHEVAAIAARLSKTDIKGLLNDRFYLASCDSCGWVGSSERCGVDTGFDDSDVYCPDCQRSGADCGEIGNRLDAPLRAHLQSKEQSAS
uniref:hypothetical protein n=1 Tax=uncultured Sphingomonas sp. TaxID=158754 RepID=UPI0035CC99DA